jgi:hypothetical protein
MYEGLFQRLITAVHNGYRWGAYRQPELVGGISYVQGAHRSERYTHVLGNN